MSFDKIEGVLLNLNDFEKGVFERILFLANVHLDEAEKLQWESGRWMTQEQTGHILQDMISDLRGQVGIKPPFPPNVEKAKHPQVLREERLRALALQRDDYHVSSDLIRCAHDRCPVTLINDNPFGHAWDLARREHWTLFTPYETERTDLYCPSEHKDL